MGLYVHKPTGERKRTVPGKYEDLRVQMDPAWEAITATPPPIKTIDLSEIPAPVDEPPESPAKKKPRSS